MNIMVREASLFRVEGPRGIYYAVYEAEQQLLFTEANEKGARDHAAEKGLTLAHERNIRHAELMRLTGRDAAPQRREPEKGTEKPTKADDAVISPLVASLPKRSEFPGNQILSTRVMGGANPFATAEPLKEEKDSLPEEPEAPAAGEVLPSQAVKREVMNFTQMPRSGRRGNPFADRSQK